MIVRDVLKHPELIENFDWFNDGDDTIRWLEGFRGDVLGSQAEIASELASKMRIKSRDYFRSLSERR